MSTGEKKESLMDKIRAIPTDIPLTGTVPSSKPAKTSPGAFGEYLARESEVFKENTRLTEKLAKFDNASPVRPLDPKTITRSKWANRHDQSFTDPEFIALKIDIESAGGNVQPIKVRPLVGQVGQFEIVFGHRRHQACLELGMPVLAMITEVNEQDLFIEMDRENRQRKDLRPYEQGMMYKRALDEGLFPSARKLAESSGIDLGMLGKALSLARLPSEVLLAFPSPLDLQYRWSSDLVKAVEKDADVVISRAKQIQKISPRPVAKIVFDQLLKGVEPFNPPAIKKVSIKGTLGQTGLINLDATDKIAVVTIKNIDPDRLEELKKLIQGFIS